MKARLICVGKPKSPHTNALFDDYATRIGKLGLPFTSHWVAEQRSGGSYSDEHVRERESGRLIELLERGERLIALDRRGESLDSEQIAVVLERWVRPRAAWVLGGPLGHHDDLLSRADTVLSLGKITLPHELARVVAAEQIYRAMTIIRRVPYHK